MLEIFEKIDRLMDIDNTPPVKHCKTDKVDFSYNPHHRHVYELLYVLHLVEEYKSECGGFAHKFTTGQTFMYVL